MDPSTRNRYGPWTCESCGHENDQSHRCESCGHDMTDDS